MNSFVLSENEDEDTVTLLLPDDENDHVWSVREVSKEEAKAIFANARKSYDSVDKSIISNNRQEYVTLMPDEAQAEASFSHFLFITLIALSCAVCIALTINLVFGIFDRP